MPGDRDPVEDLSTFLKKRDGIDKVLKVIRYTAKLLIATQSTSKLTSLKLKALDSSLGTTRKALRVGKFLGNVQDLRAIQNWSGQGMLSALSSVGEGTYYFIDQFIWLVKAGVLPPVLEPQLSKWSAYAETVGYIAAITLRSMQLQALEKRIASFEETMSHASVASSIEDVKLATSGGGDDDVLRQAQRQLAALRARRRLLQVLMVQDLADSLIALQEIVGERATVATPRTIAICGLVSASASIWKNWPR